MDRAAIPPHPGLLGAELPAPEEIAQASQQRAKVRRFTPGFPLPILVAPAAIWLTLFLVLPLLSIIVFSFWKFTGHGMEPDFTLGNYAQFFTSPIYVKTLFTTGFPLHLHPEQRPGASWPFGQRRLSQQGRVGLLV